MNQFLEKWKAQLALLEAIDNTNVTSKYFDIRKSGKFVAIAGALVMAATKTFKIELLQASDSAGTGAKGIPTTAAQAATKTVTANTEVNKATIALVSVANTDVVTVNGIDFTKAASTDATAREFADAAGLVTCVNHATYGVAGVTASAASTTVTVVAHDGYTVTVEKTENAGTITLATVEAAAVVEASIEDLDTENDFFYVAAKITTTATTTASFAVVLQGEYYNPVSQVIPSATTDD